MMVGELASLKKGEEMFAELARKRRSVKRFTSQPVEQEKIDAIIEAALRSPSGRAARPSGAAFVKDAALGIVVCGDPSKSHLWIEDCSIAAVSMQYAAHSMGLGTRWSQMRGNNYNDTMSSRDYIAGLLGLPDNLDVQCIIAIGYAGEEMVPYSKEELGFHKVSYERYGQKTA
jgi:nitroreductase